MITLVLIPDIPSWIGICRGYQQFPYLFQLYATFFFLLKLNILFFDQRSQMSFLILEKSWYLSKTVLFVILNYPGKGGLYIYHIRQKRSCTWIYLPTQLIRWWCISRGAAPLKVSTANKACCLSVVPVRFQFIANKLSRCANKESNHSAYY